jgi:hypothetical protein
MTVTVARMRERVVEVVRYADRVAFSEDCGWFMVCLDWEQPDRKKSQFRWVPADTRFEWVRTFTL